MNNSDPCTSAYTPIHWNPYWLGQPNNPESSQKYSRVVTALVLSRVAYAKDAQYCERTFKNLNYMNHGITEFIYPQFSTHKYLIAHKPSTNEIYVAFCGTDGWETLYSDICLFQIANDFQGRFHRGFYQRSKLIPLTPFINFLTKHKNFKLIFTGHSLGGAISATVTARLLFHENARHVRSRIYCIGFGTPAICDSDCSKYMDELYKDHFHFYINRNDPIPLVLSSLKNWLRDKGHDIISFLQTLGNYMNNEIEKDEKNYNIPINDVNRISLDENDLDASRSSISLFNALLDTVGINYSSFGYHFHIKINLASDDSQSENIVPLDDNDLKELNNQLYSSETRNVNWNSLVTRHQNHTIRNYVGEIYTVIESYNLCLGENSVSDIGLVTEFDSKSVLGNFLLPKKNSWSTFHENTQSTYQWSIESIKRANEEEETIKLQLEGPAVDFIIGVKCEQSNNAENLAKPDKTMTEESIRIFTLKLPLIREPTCDNYSFSLVTHFNIIDLKGLFHPHYFKSSTGLSGRQRQVADLYIMDLYKSAFSYSTFVESSTTDRSNQTDCKQRHKDVRKQLLLCESLFQNQFKSLENPLLKKDSDICQKIIEELSYVHQEHLKRESNISKPNITTETEHFISFKLVELEHIMHEWEERTLANNNTELSTVKVMHKAMPTLVVILYLMVQLNRKPVIEVVQKAALYGFLVGLPAFLTLNIRGIFVSVSTTLGGVSWAIFEVLCEKIQEIQKDYIRLLPKLARSLGALTAQIIDEPYCLEEKISTIYTEKWPQDINYIIQNWGTFFPHAPFLKVRDHLRKHYVNLVKCIDAHYQMRRLLSTDFAVGVVGPGKTGKSKLIQELFNFETKPGGTRTNDLTSYRVSSEFRIIDFPHSTSTKDELRLTYSSHHTLLNAVIVVLDANKRADEDNEKKLVATVKSLSKEGVSVLYCFNFADEFVRDKENDTMQNNRVSRFERAENASKSTPDPDNSKRVYSTSWKKEQVSETLKQFAESYDIPLANCILTCFELNVPNAEFDSTLQQLAQLGIKNPNDIKKTWLPNFLKLNNVSPERIKKTIEFWNP